MENSTLQATNRYAVQRVEKVKGPNEPYTYQGNDWPSYKGRLVYLDEWLYKHRNIETGWYIRAIRMVEAHRELPHKTLFRTCYIGSKLRAIIKRKQGTRQHPNLMMLAELMMISGARLTPFIYHPVLNKITQL